MDRKRPRGRDHGQVDGEVSVEKHERVDTDGPVGTGAFHVPGHDSDRESGSSGGLGGFGNQENNPFGSSGNSGGAGGLGGLGGLLGGLGGLAGSQHSQSGQSSSSGSAGSSPFGGHLGDTDSNSGLPYGGGSMGSGSGGGSGRRRSGCGGCLTLILILLVIGFMIYLVTGFLGSGGSYMDTLSGGSGVSDGWITEANTGTLDTSVSDQARSKYTRIKGNGKDEVTVMVYLCGADLESRGGMATTDLSEMAKARLNNDNVNVIVYTGGAKKWNNNIVSSSVNQIYQIKNGGVQRLVSNAGTGSMTDPDTLRSFIEWGADNFPANRKELILWDHGAGTISGYGHDEKQYGNDTMTLDEIDAALKGAGEKFDFIGFDTCLMATAENALMLSDYADYLIASEETEPGGGWYYSDWLTALSKDPSMSTLELGKQIIDDYTAHSAQEAPGQGTTLSMVDLSELSQTLPLEIKNFSKATSSKIEGGEFKDVSNARSMSREFGRSAKIDQIDLTHFAKIMDNSEGDALADAVLSAVKYNRTSRGMANSYGLSIYFPMRSLSQVDGITKTYKEIGMSSDYSECIQRFAQMGVYGHATSTTQASPQGTLLGGSFSSVASQIMQSDAAKKIIKDLIAGAITNYASNGLADMNSSNSNFLGQNLLDTNAVAKEVSADRLTNKDLKWKKNSSGQQTIQLTEEQWEKVSKVDMAMYYDDGQGYIDMGRDNLYDFDDDGNLVAETDRAWITISGQPVAYYHLDTYEGSNDKYLITGYVPVRINGTQAKLMLAFDQNNKNGYITGVEYDSSNGQAYSSIGKTEESLKAGDQVQFLADYYSKSGTYQSSYVIGSTMYVNDPADVLVGSAKLTEGRCSITYVFTDIYGAESWTEAIRK